MKQALKAKTKVLRMKGKSTIKIEAVLVKVAAGCMITEAKTSKVNMLGNHHWAFQF